MSLGFTAFEFRSIETMASKDLFPLLLFYKNKLSLAHGCNFPYILVEQVS